MGFMATFFVGGRGYRSTWRLKEIYCINNSFNLSETFINMYLISMKLIKIQYNVCGAFSVSHA